MEPATPPHVRAAVLRAARDHVFADAEIVGQLDHRALAGNETDRAALDQETVEILGHDFSAEAWRLFQDRHGRARLEETVGGYQARDPASDDDGRRPASDVNHCRCWR